MSKEVFKVVEYNMIGAKFYSYELMSGIDAEPAPNRDSRFEFYEAGTRTKAYNPGFPYWTFTTDLNEFKKKGMLVEASEKYVPYLAEVVEDLPGSCKGLTPKRYQKCQLMMERHGAYYQFYHKETDSVLRIAMNSHTYSPQNK